MNGEEGGVRSGLSCSKVCECMSVYVCKCLLFSLSFCSSLFSPFHHHHLLGRKGDSSDPGARCEDQQRFCQALSCLLLLPLYTNSILPVCELQSCGRQSCDIVDNHCDVLLSGGWEITMKWNVHGVLGVSTWIVSVPVLYSMYVLKALYRSNYTVSL